MNLEQKNPNGYYYYYRKSFTSEKNEETSYILIPQVQEA